MPPRDIREYQIILEYGIAIRVRTNRLMNNIEHFTAQLEYYHEAQEKWLPVVRYDSAHGQAHIDYIDPSGREYDKVWIGLFEPFNQALNAAIDELRDDYPTHIARFKEQL